MKFKLKNTRVEISFSFCALILLCCVHRDNKIFLISLVVSLFHELVHLFFICLFGARADAIKFSFMGGEIIRGTDTLAGCKEAIISLSAPVFNVVAGCILHIIYPESYWGVVNLIIGVFNLLPYEAFDGGRGLLFLLKDRVDSKALNIITVGASFVVILFLLILNGYLLKNNNGNILFLAMSLFLLILLIFRLFQGPRAPV